jgi:hypothetical protein
MHKYSLATLAIRAQSLGLDVDITGMSLTGFEIPTLPGGSRTGKDVGMVDLVIKSEGVYHLYDLKKSGTSRDWVNKYIKFFHGEPAQRGTILEDYREVLAPIFYYDPQDPVSIYAIEFSLPTDKTGATKSGQIEYKSTRFDRHRLTKEQQREFVVSRGFEWAPEKFRELNPIEDGDRIYDRSPSSLEDREAEERVRNVRRERAKAIEALERDVGKHLGMPSIERRKAVERLETFKKTGVDSGPYRNIDGAPGPVNTHLPVAVAVAAIGGAVIGRVLTGLAPLIPGFAPSFAPLFAP